VAKTRTVCDEEQLTRLLAYWAAETPFARTSRAVDKKTRSLRGDTPDTKCLFFGILYSPAILRISASWHGSMRVLYLCHERWLHFNMEVFLENEGYLLLLCRVGPSYLLVTRGRRTESSYGRLGGTHLLQSRFSGAVGNKVTINKWTRHRYMVMKAESYKAPN
jgi:hypothetical protein